MNRSHKVWSRVASILLLLGGVAGAVAPASARFVGADPVPPDRNTGENFNRYAYANDNPYRFVDPDGRLPILVPIVVGAGLTLLTTSGDAHAPAVGGATSSMSPGDAATRFIDVLPLGRAGAAGRAITFGIAPVFGNPQVTKHNGQETMHGPTSQRVAGARSNESSATSVHMSQTLATVTKGEVNSPLRGDVTTVRTDGSIDITEVLSPRQDAASTTRKYQQALGDRAGKIECIQPDKC